MAKLEDLEELTKGIEEKVGIARRLHTLPTPVPNRRRLILGWAVRALCYSASPNHGKGNGSKAGGAKAGGKKRKEQEDDGEETAFMQVYMWTLINEVLDVSDTKTLQQLVGPMTAALRSGKCTHLMLEQIQIIVARVEVGSCVGDFVQLVAAGMGSLPGSDEAESVEQWCLVMSSSIDKLWQATDQINPKRMFGMGVSVLLSPLLSLRRAVGSEASANVVAVTSHASDLVFRMLLPPSQLPDFATALTARTTILSKDATPAADSKVGGKAADNEKTDGTSRGGDGSEKKGKKGKGKGKVGVYQGTARSFTVALFDALRAAATACDSAQGSVLCDVMVDVMRAFVSSAHRVQSPGLALTELQPLALGLFAELVAIANIAAHSGSVNPDEISLFVSRLAVVLEEEQLYTVQTNLHHPAGTKILLHILSQLLPPPSSPNPVSPGGLAVAATLMRLNYRLTHKHLVQLAANALDGPSSAMKSRGSLLATMWSTYCRLGKLPHLISVLSKAVCQVASSTRDVGVCAGGSKVLDDETFVSAVATTLAALPASAAQTAWSALNKHVLASLGLEGKSRSIDQSNGDSMMENATDRAVATESTGVMAQLLCLLLDTVAIDAEALTGYTTCAHTTAASVWPGLMAAYPPQEGDDIKLSDKRKKSKKNKPKSEAKSATGRETAGLGLALRLALSVEPVVDQLTSLSTPLSSEAGATPSALAATDSLAHMTRKGLDEELSSIVNSVCRPIINNDGGADADEALVLTALRLCACRLERLRRQEQDGGPSHGDDEGRACSHMLLDAVGLALSPWEEAGAAGAAGGNMHADRMRVVAEHLKAVVTYANDAELRQLLMCLLGGTGGILLSGMEESEKVEVQQVLMGAMCDAEVLETKRWQPIVGNVVCHVLDAQVGLVLSSREAPALGDEESALATIVSGMATQGSKVKAKLVNPDQLIALQSLLHTLAALPPPFFLALPSQNDKQPMRATAAKLLRTVLRVQRNVCAAAATASDDDDAMALVECAKLAGKVAGAIVMASVRMRIVANEAEAEEVVEAMANFALTCVEHMASMKPEVGQRMIESMWNDMEMIVDDVVDIISGDINVVDPAADIAAGDDDGDGADDDEDNDDNDADMQNTLVDAREPVTVMELPANVGTAIGMWMWLRIRMLESLFDCRDRHRASTMNQPAAMPALTTALAARLSSPDTLAALPACWLSRALADSEDGESVPEAMDGVPGGDQSGMGLRVVALLLCHSKLTSEEVSVSGSVVQAALQEACAVVRQMCVQPACTRLADELPRLDAALRLLVAVAIRSKAETPEDVEVALGHVQMAIVAAEECGSSQVLDRVTAMYRELVQKCSLSHFALAFNLQLSELVALRPARVAAAVMAITAIIQAATGWQRAQVLRRHRQPLLRALVQCAVGQGSLPHESEAPYSPQANRIAGAEDALLTATIQAITSLVSKRRSPELLCHDIVLVLQAPAITAPPSSTEPTTLGRGHDSTWQAHYHMVHTLLSHHPRQTLGCMAPLLSHVRRMLASVFSTFTPRSGKAGSSGVHPFATLRKRAEMTARVMELLSSHPLQIKKYAGVLVGDFVSLCISSHRHLQAEARGRAKGGSTGEGVGHLRKALLPGVYALLSVCSQHERQSMYTSMDAGGKLSFKEMMADLKRDYAFQAG